MQNSQITLCRITKGHLHVRLFMSEFMWSPLGIKQVYEICQFQIICNLQIYAFSLTWWCYVWRWQMVSVVLYVFRPCPSSMSAEITAEVKAVQAQILQMMRWGWNLLCQFVERHNLPLGYVSHTSDRQFVFVSTFFSSCAGHVFIWSLWPYIIRARWQDWPGEPIYRHFLSEKEDGEGEVQHVCGTHNQQLQARTDTANGSISLRLPCMAGLTLHLASLFKSQDFCWSTLKTGHPTQRKQ